MITTLHNTSNEKRGEIIRRLYRGSVVSIIIAAIAAMFGMVIDGIVIGRFLGTDSMAAYGIVNPLFSVATAVSGVLATGTQVFCAKYLGAGKVDRARQVFVACMTATIAIAAAITALLFVACTPICVGLGAKGSAAHLLPLAKGYLYGLAPGILPVILLFVFNSLMRLDGDPNRVIVAVAAMTVCDIVGDLLNALVIHGGMVGMGISTAISYWVALLIMMMHFRKKDIIFRFRSESMQKKDLVGIFRVGAPTAVANVATMLRTMILNLILVAIASSTAVAALSVRNTMMSLLNAIMMGVGMTTAMISGIVYGEEDKSGARELLKISIQYALLVGGILLALTMIGAPGIVSIFSSGKENAAEMARLAVIALRCYAIALPIFGVNYVFMNYLQGIGKIKLAMLISFLENAVIVILVTLALVPAMKTNAVWVSPPVASALVFLVILLAAAKFCGHIPKKGDDLLFLADDFGAADGDTYERSLTTVDETITASKEIAAFMEERGAAGRAVTLVPLFVEEMAGNVVEHGFSKDNKPHSIDLRVLKKGEEWVIRIRDNCQAFDPLERAQIFDPNDPAANVGIRMVTGMAKDVQYVNAMQLNNLIIRI